MPEGRSAESGHARQHHEPSWTVDDRFSAFQCERADDAIRTAGVAWPQHARSDSALRQDHADEVKSYADAGYFTRNLRAIEVLVDQEVVRSGRAANQPWKFYDLGHGYCTYDFFEQCPHRMACAKCNFYLPKHSSQVQLLEGKANLVQLRQEIPLSEAEVAAVDDGIAAMEKLLEQLVDVPTPAGPTPREMETRIQGTALGKR